ncbi:MAG: UvrD-helicase domain-containing protein [bacterium]
MKDLLLNLNPRQKQAVMHTEGPLLILAGAGSGKTRVITCRVAHLIRNGVSPGSILAVTFTNKAADEMRIRVMRLLGKRTPSLPYGAYIPLISTFHSFCMRVLRQDIDKIGGRRDFVIYDEGAQMSVIKECLRELKLDDRRFRVPVFASAINKAKDGLMDFESYQILTAAGGDYFREVVNDVYTLYAQKLSRNNALDFGDLIMKCVQLLKTDAPTLAKYQERFRYIMVDEYQDTNHAQYMMTRLLAQKYKNICVVGDEDQSIYMWRGADMNNILNFEKDYARKGIPVKVLKMMDNYRSPQGVLDAANSLIRHNIQRRHDKGVLKAVGAKSKNTQNISFQELLNEVEEARCVVREVKALITRKKIKGSHIAIFYRTNAQSRVFEDILRQENISYRIVGSVEFYERKEIKDIMAYLSVLINPLDSVGLKRIANVPNRGIGKMSVTQLEIYAKREGISLYDAFVKAAEVDGLQPSRREAIKKFASFLETFRAKKDALCASELTTQLLDETGYIKALDSQDSFEARARVENVKELVSAIKEFEERAPVKNVESFLEQISLLDTSGMVPQGYEPDSAHETDQHPHINEVMLMTLHLAKGLEFDYVFVTGLEEGLLPHGSSISSEKELEEERRICYVGMTRAKKHLYLTCASERRLYGMRRWSMPSRFVQEAQIFSRMKKTEKVKKAGWRIGQKVKHPVFGNGKIVEQTGAGDALKMQILFSNGEMKKLMAKYAKLEKLYD